MSVLILSRNIPKYAKENCIVYSNNIQSWCDINCLLNDGLQVKNYGTLELDRIKLDGSFEIMPDLTQDYGYWSSDLTDEKGFFQNDCTLTFEFSEAYSSSGLTLWFDTFNNEYCNDLTIIWFDNNGGIIDKLDNYIIDNSNVYINHSVELFSKITLKFNSLNVPYRYLKLFRIDFGESYLFDNKMIEEYEVLEEIDLSRMSMPSNVASFTVKSFDTNMFRPDMQIDIYNNSLYLGMFFVEEYKNVSYGIYNVSCIDYMMHYKMDNVNVSMLISNLTTTSVQDFTEKLTDGEVFADVNVENNNYLLRYPVNTTPRNLMFVAMVNTWSIVDCSRSNKIKWYIESEDVKIVDIKRIKYDSMAIVDAQIYGGIECTYKKSINMTLPNSYEYMIESYSIDDSVVENLKGQEFWYNTSTIDGAIDIYNVVGGASGSPPTVVTSSIEVEKQGGHGWFYWKFLRRLKGSANRVWVLKKSGTLETITDRKLISDNNRNKTIQITIPFISNMLSNSVETYIDRLYNFYVKEKGFTVYKFDMEIVDEKCGDKIQFSTNLNEDEKIGIIQSCTFKNANKNIATVEVVV